MSCAAVGFACLIFASESIQTWMGLALHLFLLLSVLGAFYAPRERRAFWGGCALMGWYYLGSNHLPSDLQQPRNSVHEALAEIHPKIAREVPNENFPVRYTGDKSLLPSRTRRSPRIGEFLGVAHTLATFLAAFVGGGVALWFDRRASRKPAAGAPPPLS
jgi:hypothetical protein